MDLESKLLQLCRDKQLTLSLAESCTGGALSARITSVPGASDYFIGGVVSYSNFAKQKVLGVPQKTLLQSTAVSQPVVILMLEGVLKLFKTDLAIAVTGLCGPGGGSEKIPVGTLFIAVGGTILKTEHYEFHLSGDRQAIIAQAVDCALDVLLDCLKRCLDTD